MAVVSFRKGRTCTNYLWANTKIRRQTEQKFEWWYLVPHCTVVGQQLIPTEFWVGMSPTKLPIWQQLKTLLGSQTWSLDGSRCPLSMSQNLQLPESREQLLDKAWAPCLVSSCPFMANSDFTYCGKLD